MYVTPRNRRRIARGLGTLGNDCTFANAFEAWKALPWYLQVIAPVGAGTAAFQACLAARKDSTVRDSVANAFNGGKLTANQVSSYVQDCRTAVIAAGGSTQDADRCNRDVVAVNRPPAGPQDKKDYAIWVVLAAAAGAVVVGS